MSNDRPEPRSAVERAAVRISADGVTSGDRFVPPIATHHSQQVATFRALSRALAKRRYGLVAFVGFHALLWSLVAVSRALGVGDGGAGMVVFALEVLAILTIFAAPTRLSVGADGILRRWLWTQRFLGYHEISRITRFDKVWFKVWLRARQGAGGWQYTGQVMELRVAPRSGEEVLMPIATSPARPSASIWRANSSSKPRSLPIAVSAEVSVESEIAAMGLRLRL